MSKDATHLSQLLEQAAARRPNHPAVEDECGQTLSYAELAHAADRLATRLARWGVSRGDRVGLFLPKSLAAVAAIHGVLRAGAAYVPVDPTAPAGRGAGIFRDGQVKVVIVAGGLASDLIEAWPASSPLPRLIVAGQPDQPLGAQDAAWEDLLADDAPSPLPPAREPSDLAYILYTSGSTGQPKGVMLSHANAFCFLDWCDETLHPHADDRFSSHAPFHFDLSIFDLFASCRRGATLVLIGEALGKEPGGLGRYLAERRISVWYSAPSILALLAQYGALDRPGPRAPRLVLFAGEVFPIQHLRRLRELWPDTELWNLYGPTETNVCTAYPIPDTIPEERGTPYPIGRVCPPLRSLVVDDRGRQVMPGEAGELLIAGPGVMRGYFGRPDLTAEAFVHDPDGTAWYRTGDLVTDDGSGCYQFHGRRDRMVKKRGYRIELGEIEAALYRHEGVDQAAVVAEPGDLGVAIAAFVALKPEHKPSIIAMKRHCTLYLPHYMIPDSFAFVDQLPKTSTDKVDYQGLKRFGRKTVPAPLAESRIG